MAKPVKLAHVVYATRRFDEMVAWYRDVFEARVVHGDAVFAFLTYDDEHHRIAIVNLDALKPIEAGASAEKDEVGVNHVAFTYASAGDLLDTYKRLKGASILPYWPVHHGITLSLYYRDPDGNRLEFQVDVGNAADAAAFMTSPTFAENPVGTAFDPEMLLARYEAGTAEAMLLAYPEGPPSNIPTAHGLG
jgi:catechol 2,3-dioxygenase-like lactoylglutathione lyase family enzyme